MLPKICKWLKGKMDTLIERLNLVTHMLQIGLLDVEGFINFTRIKVDPKLKRRRSEASQPFIPRVSLEKQAQIRLDLELARLNGGRKR